ncbi:Bile acid-coenzyme A ligase [Mycolicibacterium vanbaalenii]|uniref:Bile acid-coenzyme A ligase n=1 Tax=Mycolicibacterium vanbaalenii TaxID=110539 RepID=A0A5S9QXN8_MYCVN|nr:AMP-binding protein [Mycolicibacterium vanbaalenii]CAA0124895.1 Bile acid-coenzyme A ligase [Mycolicibacterium vanbaalenii]
MTSPVPPIGTQASALAAQDPGAPAVTCEGVTVTRAELDATSNRLARAFASLGVGTGDYVTIAAPNSLNWVYSVVACWKLGAVPQPLSARLPDAELAALLELRRPTLLVGRADPSGVTTSTTAEVAADASGFSDGPLPEAVSPVWKSMASGGSTGRPKLIEAGGDSRVPAAIGYPLGAQEDDTNLISVPLSHNTGFTTFVIGLLQGHHLVVMPRFEPHDFLHLVTEHRVTFLATVPTIMQRLLPVYRAAPGSYDLSSIRRFWHLAAPCPPAVKRAWIELLGPEVVWELYGGTELQALTFISGQQWLRHPGSVGTVVAGEMKVLDDDGNECPPGVAGEIYMRPSPGGRPTYRYIGSTAKSRDGWDSLGDLGYYRDAGDERYFYLNDRRVDMFTVGGRNVYPAEIESALAEHPEVLSCLVVSVPDDDLGQVPHAIVQAEGLDEAAVLAFLTTRIAAYKVPRSVEFTTRALRDDAGKARRSAVRDEVLARRAAPSG